VKRGEVYYANLEPVLGSETGKTRPVVIIQNDIGNAHSPTTIIAIITEYSEKKASYPICVAVGIEQGLKKPSIVNLAQVRTIDKRQLIMQRVANLPDATMAQVDRALKHSLSLS
jgi:mRNA interferase MazF